MLRLLNGYDVYPTGTALTNLIADSFYSAVFGETQLSAVSPGRFDKGKSFKNRAILDGADIYEAVGHRYTTETCVVGNAVFIPNIGGALPGNHFGFGVYDGEGGVGNQFMISFEDLGIIRLYRGGTIDPTKLIATTPAGTYNLDQWFWFEMKFKVHPTSGLVEVRVNTVTKISYTGNTAVGTPILGAAPGWDGFHWMTPGFNGPYTIWDDLYLLDDTGSDNTDYLGNVRVNTQFTVAPGDLTQFSKFGAQPTNWQTVNGTALDDTQYVYDGTIGQKDLYTMDPNVSAQNVFGIQVRGAYRQDDSTQMVARNIIKTGGVIYEGSVDHYLTGTYTYYRDIWEKNPGTGVGWTAADLNAIQAGTKVQA